MFSVTRAAKKISTINAGSASIASSTRISTWSSQAGPSPEASP